MSIPIENIVWKKIVSCTSGTEWDKVIVLDDWSTLFIDLDEQHWWSTIDYKYLSSKETEAHFNEIVEWKNKQREHYKNGNNDGLISFEEFQEQFSGDIWNAMNEMLNDQMKDYISK
jgi:hypothetical protein